MIEIIKSGNTGIQIFYENTCPWCGCHYKYQQEDSYINPLGGNAEIRCPECGMPNISAVYPRNVFGGTFNV